MNAINKHVSSLASRILLIRAINSRAQALLLTLCIFGASQVMAIPQSGDDIATAYSKSYNYEAVGDITNAINVLVAIKKKFPTTYQVNMRLGHLYARSNHYADALSLYQTAAKSKPSAIPPLLAIMRIKNIQKQFIATEEIAYQILKRDSTNYYANVYLTYALRSQKKLDVANKINLKMLAIYPEDVTFLLEHALTEFAKKDLQAARKALEYLLILNPENPTGHELLAKIKIQETPRNQ